MVPSQNNDPPRLLDERSPHDFRRVFGDLLSESSVAETAIHRVRLGAVDLSRHETRRVRRLRVLVAEANTRTVEAEAYAMTMDPRKRENLNRVLGLLTDGIMEIRSAPLGGWSPDFTVFSSNGGPQNLLIGLHWFHVPFPHRGPAWAAHFGADEARLARSRFQDLWGQAHDIGAAVRRLMQEMARRGPFLPGLSPKNESGMR